MHDFMFIHQELSGVFMFPRAVKWVSEVIRVVKNPPANAGDVGPIPGSGRSPGEGRGNPLQYPCLGNPMDRGAWQGALHGVARVGRN